MAFKRPLFLSALCSLFLCLPVFASTVGPDRCLAGLFGFTEDTEAPFAGDWGQEKNYFEQFAPFERVLMLSDGPHLTDSIRVAARFPEKQVTGTDRRVRVSGTLPENLRALPVDTRAALPFAGGTFDLVFLQCGLCHCKDGAQACCGVNRSDPDIFRFLTEVVRVLDLDRPDSMAFLHGLLEPAVFFQWLAQCKLVASPKGLRCVPQIYFDTGYFSPFWGFKIRK